MLFMNIRKIKNLNRKQSIYFSQLTYYIRFTSNNRLNQNVSRILYKKLSTTNYEKKYLFLKSHEYIQMNGNIGTIGITPFGQKMLGDIVSVDLPLIGTEIEKDTSVGYIESVKAASDLITPVSGVVVELNELLSTEPELINQNPLEKGWILKVNISTPSELDNLLDQAEYDKFCKEEDLD